ncbi:PH domain-containing protein [Lysobacter soli]|uniref:PH domain-containing protein n=1 Tax=Lysobacter soli TaxID=453783 RepID=UPI00240EC98F|nr:PH domain-containing protein [Lysobacter soli]MDG2517396.1 PH domain-containing protein [Lysobacter soli]
MTTPDAPSPDAAPDATVTAERRLHPMSWLFVLVQQLKQFVLPLVALLVFGRGDRNELWPLIGVAVLVVLSLWQYFTYRYGVAGDRLVVRSGLFERSLRVIPFARIHNVALQQSALHRVFGVAEVRLESAGGSKPEAQMRVLKLEDALALEALVRHRGATAAASANEPESTTLLALPFGEIVRLGLVSNRGLVVVAAAFAAIVQISQRAVLDTFRSVGKWLFGFAGEHHFGMMQYVVSALALVLFAILVLRGFSILLALLQYHGFRLSEIGRRLTVERGLLARWRTSASRRRIQAWTLHEGTLHRLLKRRSLDVDTAVAEEHQQQRALRELAPIATPADCDALIEHLLPRAGWTQLDWRALPASNWWRLVLPTIPVVIAITIAASWRFGAWGLVALAWLPWAAFVAYRRARRMAYAANAEIVAVREGWWTRHWRFAELDKLQALQLTRSPLDRRCGTATLHLDTSGAGALSPPLRVRFLPHDDALALYASLSRTLARRALRW